MRLTRVAIALASLLAVPVLAAAPARAVAQVKLVPADPQSLAGFGFALASDGATLVAGEPWHHGASSASGRVHVFRRAAAAWVLEALLDAEDELQLGVAVAVDGDTIAALAGGGPAPAFVVMFRRDATGWRRTQRIALESPGGIQSRSLALQGDTLAVGVDFPGVVAVYRFDGSRWTPTQTLRTSPGSGLGYSVALDGGTLVAGDPYDDDERGSVTVWRRYEDDWLPEARLTAPAGVPSIHLGASVAVHASTIVAGGFSFWLDPRQAGAVHVFALDAAGWGHARTIGAPPETPEMFGSAVAVDDRNVLIGSRGDNGYAGRAYLIRRSGRAAGTLEPLDPEPAASFGAAVTLAAGTPVVGAPSSSILTRSPAEKVGGVYSFFAVRCLHDAGSAARLPCAALGRAGL